MQFDSHLYLKEHPPSQAVDLVYLQDSYRNFNVDAGSCYRNIWMLDVVHPYIEPEILEVSAQSLPFSLLVFQVKVVKVSKLKMCLSFSQSCSCQSWQMSSHPDRIKNQRHELRPCHSISAAMRRATVQKVSEAACVGNISIRDKVHKCLWVLWEATVSLAQTHTLIPDWVDSKYSKSESKRQKAIGEKPRDLKRATTPFRPAGDVL